MQQRLLVQSSISNASERRPSYVFSNFTPKTTASSAMQSATVLYLIIFLMLGVVTSISGFLENPREHHMYRDLFDIAIYGLGIVIIIYFNVIIMLNRSKRNKDKKAEAETQDHTESMEDDNAFTYEYSLYDPEKTEDKETKREIRVIFYNGLKPDFQLLIPASSKESETIEQSLISNGNCHSQSLDLQHFVNNSSTASLVISNQTETENIETDIISQNETVEDEGKHDVFEEFGAGACCVEMQVSRAPALSRSSVLDRVHKFGKNMKTITRTASGIDFLKKKLEDTDLIIESKEGVNLYLRLGAMIFGFGVMIHNGVKILEGSQNHENVKTCRGVLWITKHLVYFLYVMVQNYHLFKNHRIVFNVHKPMIRFGHVHLIIINLCLWMKTCVYEIQHNTMWDKHSTPLSTISSQCITNSSTSTIGSSDINNNTTNSTKLSNALEPYLYPCAVEYGLICAAICYKIFQRVGDKHVKRLKVKTKSSSFHFPTCDKSHRGLFIGLIIMMLTMVSLATFLYFTKKGDNNEYFDHVFIVQSTEIFVLLVCTLVSIWAVIKVTKRLDFVRLSSKEAFDTNLLFVGLAGILCYNLFVSVSVASWMIDLHNSTANSQTPNQTNISITKLHGLKSLMEVVESTCQTFMVMECMRRSVRNYNQLASKPGRGCIIMLLIANLAMWIVSVFEGKKDKYLSSEFFKQHFGNTKIWQIVMYIFKPLIIFYRFHSSVCLSDLWSKTYRNN